MDKCATQSVWTGEIIIANATRGGSEEGRLFSQARNCSKIRFVSTGRDSDKLEKINESGCSRHEHCVTIKY